MKLKFLFLVVLLVACQQQSLDYDQYVGTQGLAITFADGAPPSEVYEKLPFPVKLRVHNQGALPVDYEKMRFSFSVDPLYIDGGVALLSPEKGDPGYKLIQGRSISYIDGETRLYSVPSSDAFSARTVLGTIQKPKTSISANVCYVYTTTLTSEVCIDTNTFHENQRAQSCTGADLSFGEGQGAPVAITSIEVEALPVVDPTFTGESIRPFFTIHLSNSGGGRLIGPDTLPLETACLLKGIPKDELGAARVQMWLLDGELECTPSVVRFYNEEATTRCTVPIGDLSDPVFASMQNFMTTLLVNVSYLYQSSASAEVAIKRNSIVETELPRYGKIDGYVYEGEQMVLDGAGKPVTECKYLAEHLDEATDYQRSRMTPAWDCSCSRRQCERDMDKCLPSLCPADSWCCGEPPELNETG